MSLPQIDLFTASTPNGWRVSVFLYLARKTGKLLPKDENGESGSRSG